MRFALFNKQTDIVITVNQSTETNEQTTVFYLHSKHIAKNKYLECMEKGG